MITPLRVVVTAQLVVVGVLGVAELRAHEQELRDSRVSAALSGLRASAVELDLMAFESLIVAGEDHDELTRALRRVWSHVVTDPPVRKNPRPPRLADTAGVVVLSAAVDARFQAFYDALLDREKKIADLKAHRGRLINVDHYLPLHLGELSTAHPNDDTVAAMQKELLRYLLFPSTDHSHDLERFTKQVMSDSSTSCLKELAPHLASYTVARNGIEDVTGALRKGRLAGALQPVIDAHDEEVSAHRAAALRLRAASAVAFGVLALLALWWPQRRPRWWPFKER